jgi:hypothetical protein
MVFTFILYFSRAKMANFGFYEHYFWNFLMVSNCRVTLLLIRQFSLKVPLVLYWMHLLVLPCGRLDLITGMVNVWVSTILLCGCEVTIEMNLFNLMKLFPFPFHFKELGMVWELHWMSMRALKVLALDMEIWPPYWKAWLSAMNLATMKTMPLVFELKYALSATLLCSWKFTSAANSPDRLLSVMSSFY